MKAISGAVLIACGLAVVGPAAGPAFGQAPPDSRQPVPPKAENVDPRACGPDGTHATVGKGGDVVVRKPDDQTLSSKLAQSGGVICPPAVDPEIKAPTPEAGRTPVIPPPGSPGGNPQVQPK